jgi:hypothetical protein
MSITVSDSAVLTGESLGRVLFTYTENLPHDPLTDFVTIKFYPEFKHGYQRIAIDSKTVIGVDEQVFGRDAARNVWNLLIEMGFHL